MLLTDFTVCIHAIEIGLLKCLLCCIANIDDVVLCIAHRGRLNLLTCLLKYPPVVMFQKVSSCIVH